MFYDNLLRVKEGEIGAGVGEVLAEDKDADVSVFLYSTIYDKQ